MLEQYKKGSQKPFNKRKLILFVSDKFWNYKAAWKKLFYRITKIEFGVPIACKKFGLKHNNNSVERHNRELSRRFDALNVFQTHEGATAISALCKMLHNYVNPHGMLYGKTPAESAKLMLPLGENRLLNLIKIARKIEMTTSWLYPDVRTFKKAFGGNIRRGFSVLFPLIPIPCDAYVKWYQTGDLVVPDTLNDIVKRVYIGRSAIGSFSELDLHVPSEALKY